MGPKVNFFVCHFISISTLNFGLSSMKLGENVRAIKKMTHNGRIYGETAVLCLAEKWFLGQKSVFFPQKHPKFAKRLIFIWETGTFLFGQLFPVGPFRTLGSIFQLSDSKLRPFS